MRKKTYEEKAHAGTIKLGRVREAKLTVTQTIPKPQAYLSNDGKRIYKAICQHILNHNSLCSIDSFYVSGVALNFDIFTRMATMIEAKEAIMPGSGYFQTFANGTVQNSPYFNTMNKAWDNIEKGCKALALNVKSRDAILAFAKKPDDEEANLDELNLN